ncbi:unnamed protein product [Peniophora sp. CBMAI 1063]|nr:unnamed protein product [Peniophora sp. CBMAI 1063]
MASLSSTKTIKRDDFFYFHSLVFEVEDTLFKVPRYGLPGDGAAFDTMFARGPGAPGSSDDDPIRLDTDVTASEFRSMLKATYPPPGTTVAELTLDEWMSVLKLAKKWNLAGLRDKAVQQSDTQVQLKTPIEKILLARQYDVGKWLNEAYIALSSREEPLSVQEVEKVGWETTAKLMMVREKRWRTPQTPPKATVKCTGCQSTPSCYSCHYNRGCSFAIEAVIDTSTIVSGTFNYANAVQDVFGKPIFT